MLDLHSIYKTFNAGTVNEKTALNGLNLHLNEGDFVTVIGGNGAGKSTMLNAVAGTWFVDEGKITIDDIDVTKLPEHKRAKYLGRVFQDPMTGTAATMQIEENMALAARRGMTRSLKTGDHRERERVLQRAVKDSGTWPGGPPYIEGRSSLRRTETGADTSHGNLKEAETSSLR